MLESQLLMVAVVANVTESQLLMVAVVANVTESQLLMVAVVANVTESQLFATGLKSQWQNLATIQFLVVWHQY